MVEIALFIAAFGLKNYFKFYYNFIFVIATTLFAIWLILDLIDRDEFREYGAYRFLKTLLIVLRFNEARLIFELRFTSMFKQVVSPAHTQIHQLLSKIQYKVHDTSIKEQIDICKSLVSQLKNQTQVSPRKTNSKPEQEFCLNKAAISKNKRRDSYNIRQGIKDKVKNYNFEADLALTPKIKEILQDVQEYEFDIFQLNKATGGNEMTVLSTFLLNKHNLFVN